MSEFDHALAEDQHQFAEGKTKQKQTNKQT